MEARIHPLGSSRMDTSASQQPFAVRLAECGPRLRLVLAHMAGPRLRAHVELDDLAQETMLRALSSANAPVDEAELWRWLVAIARHVAIDAARALRARRHATNSVRLERADWSRIGMRESRVAARGPGASTLVAAHEDEGRLLQAFARLSPEHRRVIGLRQFEGLSAAEAAVRLHRTETAVHSLYRRALLAWDAAAK